MYCSGAEKGCPKVMVPGDHYFGTMAPINVGARACAHTTRAHLRFWGPKARVRFDQTDPFLAIVHTKLGTVFWRVPTVPELDPPGTTILEVVRVWCACGAHTPKMEVQKHPFWDHFWDPVLDPFFRPLSRYCRNMPKTGAFYRGFGQGGSHG